MYGTFQAQLTGTNWDQGNALPFGAAAHEGGTPYTTTTPALEEGFYEYKYIVGFDADDAGYYGGSAEHGLPKVIAGVREHLATGDAERRDAFPIVIDHLTGWDAIHVANTVDATGCWALIEDGLGRWIGELLGRLAAMRRDHPVLRAPNMYPANWPSDRRTPYDNGYGIDADRQTVVYHRWGHDAAGALHRYLIVPTSQPVTVPLPDGGTWSDLINGAAVTADDGNVLHGYVVESHWGHVFHKTG